MSTPDLVRSFYQRIWENGELDAAAELLSPDFVFRGSLGAELHGLDAFKDYVRAVRMALTNYRCEILTCVAEGQQGFARMRFSGRHAGVFLGYRPTGKPVQWEGAALFQFRGPHICSLWVLGDLAGLDALLKANEAPT
jgi:predicted ester cyclase